MVAKGSRMNRLAVVDVETTGFGKLDRIVEVGVVVLDGDTWDVIDEYDTLVNPMRDMGATHVHGITASMVEAAPTFDEIAVSLASVLHGAVLVAHNLPFDARMLRQDYARTGVTFDPGAGLDTLSLAGERLPSACARYGIAYTDAHWALADARAVAGILQALEPDMDCKCCQAHSLDTAMRRTYSRMALDGHEPAPTSLRFSSLRYPTTATNEIAYLDVLDRFLSDRVLDDDERAALADLSSAMGISSHEQRYLHLDYMQALIYAARRDNVVTEAEHQYLVDIAHTLGLSVADLPPVTETATPSSLDGLRVCFTGSAVVNGQPLERRTLETMAAQHGLQPVASVSKKGCDLLVAADASSASGKATKAREAGILVMSVADFLNQIAR